VVRISSLLCELYGQLAEIPAWALPDCHPVAPERLWAIEHWAPPERAWFLRRIGGSAAFIAADALDIAFGSGVETAAQS
jgi:hypothetical protein